MSSNNKYPDAVAIRIANATTVVIEHDLNATVNGRTVSGYPYRLPADGSRITRVGRRIRIYLANAEVVVSWDGSHLVQVAVPPQFFNKTCGLCGRYNGDSTDDLVGRDGVVFRTNHLTPPTQISRKADHLFGISWTALSGERILLDDSYQCVGTTEEPLNSFSEKLEATPGTTSVPTAIPSLVAQRYCSFLKDPKGVYADCHSYRDPEESFQACAFDIDKSRGDTNNSCGVIQSYESLCRRLGATSIGSVVDQCGVCFGDGSTCEGGVTCSTWGDGYYTTFDNVSYYFQGQYEYILAQDCLNQDFTVHVENGASGGGGTTQTKTVAILIKDSGVVRLYDNGEATVNSRRVDSFPHRLPGDGTVLRRTAQHVEVRIASSGATVTFDGSRRIAVTVPVGYAGRTCGLCGVYDFKPGNDLTLKNGTVVKVGYPFVSHSVSSQRTIHNFGISWAVDGIDRLMLDPKYQSNHTIKTLPKCSNDNEAKARQYCEVITSEIYSPCHSILDSRAAIKSCVFDVCRCHGDVGCGCDAIKEYEAKCRQSGVVTGLATVVDHCGVCNGNGMSCRDEPTCSIHGGLHYQTFDNARYQFEANCEYVLTKDCIHHDFTISIHIGDYERSGSVKSIKSLAIKVPGVATIILLESMQTLVNNVEIEKDKYPYVIGVDGTVIDQVNDEAGKWMSVTLASSRVKIFLNGKNEAKVVAPELYKQRLCGLCGNYDGNATNDLQLRNGTVLAPHQSTDIVPEPVFVSEYYDFGQDWIVPSVNRLLLPDNATCSVDKLVSTNTQGMDANLRAKVMEMCADIMNQTRYKRCRTAMDVRYQQELCIYDTSLCLKTGGASCYCAALKTFEDSCRSFGVRDFDPLVDECGVCYGDGSTCAPDSSTCAASIDHHYSTLDGAVYDFKSDAEYVFVQDCENDDFSVHLTNGNRSDTQTPTKSVAIRITAGPIVKVWKNCTVQVNGRIVTKFPHIFHGTVVRKDMAGMLMKVEVGSSGLQVIWDGLANTVYVVVPPKYKNQTCGLCGNYDDDLENDVKFASNRDVYPTQLNDSLSDKQSKVFETFPLVWAAAQSSRMLVPYDSDGSDGYSENSTVSGTKNSKFQGSIASKTSHLSSEPYPEPTAAETQTTQENLKDSTLSSKRTATIQGSFTDSTLSETITASVQERLTDSNPPSTEQTPSIQTHPTFSEKGSASVQERVTESTSSSTKQTPSIQTDSTLSERVTASIQERVTDSTSSSTEQTPSIQTDSTLSERVTASIQERVTDSTSSSTEQTPSIQTDSTLSERVTASIQERVTDSTSSSTEQTPSIQTDSTLSERVTASIQERVTDSTSSSTEQTPSIQTDSTLSERVTASIQERVTDSTSSSTEQTPSIQTDSTLSERVTASIQERVTDSTSSSTKQSATIQGLSTDSSLSAKITASAEQLLTNSNEPTMQTASIQGLLADSTPSEELTAATQGPFADFTPSEELTVTIQERLTDSIKPTASTQDSLKDIISSTELLTTRPIPSTQMLVTCQESIKQAAERYCHLILKSGQPYGSCHRHINPYKAYLSCINDVCGCDGSRSCACPAIKAYEGQCRNLELNDVHIGTVVDLCDVCEGNDSCVTNGSTCVTSTQSRYNTFDGAFHHFRGKCEYVLAADCSSSATFSIHVRNEYRENDEETWTRSVAITTPTLESLLLLPRGVVIYNGSNLTDFPDWTEDGTWISKTAGMTRVQLSGSSVVVLWDGHQTVRVTVAETYMNKTCGLCGLLDHTCTNDLTLRNGTVVHPSNKYYSESDQSLAAYFNFGSSWVVPPHEALLADDGNACKDEPVKSPYEDNPQLRQNAEKYCSFIRQKVGMYSTCHPLIDPNEKFYACVSDYFHCGQNRSGSECGCQSAVTYEKQCQRANVTSYKSVVDNCGVCGGDGTSCRRDDRECAVFSSQCSALIAEKQRYVTFDGLVHQFQGSCEYVLARDCTGGLFDIHVENYAPAPDIFHFVWTRSIAVRTKDLGLIKAIVSPLKILVYVNDRHFSSPSTIVGSGGSRVLVFSDGIEERVEILLDDSEVKISLFGDYKIAVTIPMSFNSKACGLCGNSNGNSNDDLKLSDGRFLNSSHVLHSIPSISISDYNTFGSVWTLLGNDRLILKPEDTCQDSFVIPYCEQNVENRKKIEEFCDVIRDASGPFADCHSFNPPRTAYEKCVESGCLHHGKRLLTCSVINSYRTECQKRDQKFVDTIVPECLDGQ